MNPIKQSLCVTFCAIALAACGNGGTPANSNSHASAPRRRVTLDAGNRAVFIPADSANKMIKSYLSSINATGNDSDLKSLIFDADSLRAYLSDTSIKHVKVMLAHTLEYINANGSGNDVGYRSDALTAVFGGYDANGNYVFWNGNNVLDHGNPCPTSCLVNGNASSDLFPVNQ